MQTLPIKVFAIDRHHGWVGSTTSLFYAAKIEVVEASCEARLGWTPREVVQDGTTVWAYRNSR